MAREVLRKLWVTPSNLVDLRLGLHGFECFMALFYELNQALVADPGPWSFASSGPLVAPRSSGPFIFETRRGSHLGLVVSGSGLVGRRVCWFDRERQERLTGRVDDWRLKEPKDEGYESPFNHVEDHGFAIFNDGCCVLTVTEDEQQHVIEIDGPWRHHDGHDMHIVEDFDSSVTCMHVPPQRNHDDQLESPDIATVVGLNELSHMAVEVYNTQVVELARQLLLDLVAIWEEIPGALKKVMDEKPHGVASQRLRDTTAQHRLTQLEADIVACASRAVTGVFPPHLMRLEFPPAAPADGQGNSPNVKESLLAKGGRMGRPLPSECFKCHNRLDPWERAPVCLRTVFAHSLSARKTYFDT